MGWLSTLTLFLAATTAQAEVPVEAWRPHERWRPSLRPSPDKEALLADTDAERVLQLCDPDPELAAVAFLSLAPLLPPDALDPWRVHPAQDVASLANWALDGAASTRALPDPERAAHVAEVWASARCQPVFAGRYDLAVWAPSLAASPLEIELLDTQGQVVARSATAARDDWAIVLPLAVVTPPARARFVQGRSVVEIRLPPGPAAAVALTCEGDAPLTWGEHPARPWSATRDLRRQLDGCAETIAPRVASALRALPDDQLLRVHQLDLSLDERGPVTLALLGSDRSPSLRLELARRVLRHGRDEEGCSRVVAAALAGGVYDDDLDRAQRFCRRIEPALFGPLLEAVESGAAPVTALIPLPPRLSTDDQARITSVAATALAAASPSERAGPFRVLLDLDNRDGGRLPRVATAVSLPDGGAAIAFPTPCLADAPRSLVDGVLVLAPAPPDHAGLQVELLSPVEAAQVHTVACGARLLWQRTPQSAATKR